MVVTQKREKNQSLEIDKHGAQEIARKAKKVKEPLSFKYKRSRYHLPKGGGNTRGRQKKRKQEERKRMREYNEK